jgi:hypothetical protein
MYNFIMMDLFYNEFTMMCNIQYCVIYIFEFPPDDNQEWSTHLLYILL